MSFNPLGSFNPNAPVNPKILAKARAFQATLPTLPAGSLKRLYLHWTAGDYDTLFTDYNGMVECVNGEWAMKLTHDPSDNAIGVNDNKPAPHTFERNTGAIGVSIAAMLYATTHDFGADPVTVVGLEHLCALSAAFCAKYGVDTLGTAAGGPYAGEPNILTHGEAGDLPGNPSQYPEGPYGPLSTCERWDLVIFAPLPDGESITAADVKTCGDALRKLTHTYKVALS